MSGADVSGIGHSYDHVPVTELPIDVAIDRYVPRHVKHWEEFRTTMTTIVKAANPASYHVAREFLSIGYAWLEWLVTVACVTVASPEQLITERNMRRYIQQLPKNGRSPRERIMARYLSRLVEVRTSERPETDLFIYPDPKPYSRDELAAACSFANTRRTPRQTRTLRMIVALGAGAGLSLIEMEALRHRDLAQDHVLVTTQRPRVVPILPQWREWLTHSGDPDAYIILPATMRHRRRGQVLRNFMTDVDDNEVNAVRLRSTWVVALLDAGVPPAALLRLAGWKVFHALNPYIPFMTPVDDIALLDLINQIQPEETR